MKGFGVIGFPTHSPGRPGNVRDIGSLSGEEGSKLQRTVRIPTLLDEAVQRFAHEDERSYSGALVETHHLTVDEAVSIQYAARDCRIHEAEGVLLGRASIPVGDFSDCSDVELLDRWAHWQTELGETARELRQALAAGRVTHEQIRRVRREMFEDFQAALGVLDRLEGMVDDR
jgi:hypothetical protein